MATSGRNSAITTNCPAKIRPEWKWLVKWGSNQGLFQQPVKRFIKAVGKTAKYGVYGPSSEQVAAKAAKGAKGVKGAGGHKAGQGGLSKGEFELKPMSSVAGGAPGKMSPGGGVKETKFTVTRKTPVSGLKTFGPNVDVFDKAFGKHWIQMEGIPPGTMFTQPPMKEFSPAMKARASQVLGAKPAVTAPPRYPTLDSIQSGEALKQAYTTANPIGHLNQALKGAIDRAPSLNATSMPSLGGQPQLLKTIKGGIDTLDKLKTEVAIVKNRQYLMGDNGRLVDAEPYKDHLKRLNRLLK